MLSFYLWFKAWSLSCKGVVCLCCCFCFFVCKINDFLCSGLHIVNFSFSFNFLSFFFLRGRRWLLLLLLHVFIGKLEWRVGRLLLYVFITQDNFEHWTIAHSMPHGPLIISTAAQQPPVEIDVTNGRWTKFPIFQTDLVMHLSIICNINK